MKSLYFSILFIIIASTLSAQRLNIAVFYNYRISSVVMNVYMGSYNVYEDTVLLMTLVQNDIMLLTAKNDSVEVKKSDGKILRFKKIIFEGISEVNVLKFKPTVPSMQQRYYDDDMQIKTKNGCLCFNNLVRLENYICGVVESESGYQASEEFYKTQAILCRTFTLENLGKHYAEQFNLCDGVHCQAYKGKNYSLSYHAVIAKAVNDTRDLVMVDTSGSVIDAPFHANCGGQTMNAEDVWGSYKYYLRSVNDSFCKYQRNIYWKKKISMVEWKNFLTSNNIDFPLANDTAFNFVQPNRKSFYNIEKDSISLRKIREYFNLKSTFFNLKTEGDSLLISGKGFGHGVGLCQDGAMQMAKRGYSYSNIIAHYYKGVKIVSYKSIPFYQSILSDD